MSIYAFKSYSEIMHLIDPYVRVRPLNKGHKICSDISILERIRKWIKTSIFLDDDIDEKIELPPDDESIIMDLWRNMPNICNKLPTIYSFTDKNLVEYFKQCTCFYPIGNVLLSQCTDNINYFFIPLYSIIWASNRKDLLEVLDSWYIKMFSDESKENSSSVDIFNDYIKSLKPEDSNVEEILDVSDHRITYHLLQCMIRDDIVGLEVDLNKIGNLEDYIDPDIFQAFRIYFKNLDFINDNFSKASMVFDCMNSNEMPYIPIDLAYYICKFVPNLLKDEDIFIDFKQLSIEKGRMNSPVFDIMVKNEEIDIIKRFCDSYADIYVRKVFVRAVSYRGIRSKEFLDDFYTFQSELILEKMRDVDLNEVKDLDYFNLNNEIEMYEEIFANLYILTKEDLELLKSQIAPVKNSFSGHLDIIASLRSLWISKNPEFKNIINHVF